MTNVFDWKLRTSVAKFSNNNTVLDLGKKFTSSIQIIQIDSSIKRNTWEYGGELFAAYSLLGKPTLFAEYKLKLNYQQLIQVPQYFAEAYSLFYKPPKWFSTYTIKIFEYQNMPLNLDGLQANADSESV